MTIVSILVATFITFIVSSLYYSPLLMGKVWQKAVGVKMDFKNMTPSKMAKTFGTTFLLYFIQFFIVAFFMARLGVTTSSEAIIVSIMAWLLIDTSALVKGMYEQKSCKGVMIGVGDDLIRIILGSLILVWMM